MEALSFMDVLREAMACAVVAVDQQQHIKTFTPEAESLTHLKADQVLDQPLSSLPAELRAPIQETFDRGQPVSNREIILRGGASDESLLRINTTLLRNGHDQVNGVVAVLNDFSSAGKIAQKMSQLDRLASVGTLAASMAHEIKNALVPVRTFVDLLLQQNKDAELADIVIREMRRVESIVSQMLKFAGPAKPTFAPVPVHLILDQALQLIQHQLEGKKLCLDRAFRALPDTVIGDTYQLEQAFLNLFLNAIEAMGPNGKLSIATEHVEDPVLTLKESGAITDRWLCIVVTDTGTGAPPENVERMFEPFFTTKPNGTGLGLTITRRIITEHQGTIQVESELNQGTTFRLLIPLVPGNGAGERAAGARD